MDASEADLSCAAEGVCGKACIHGLSGDEDEAELFMGGTGAGLGAMLAYYPSQGICSSAAWDAVLASLKAPWQVTGRLSASVGWQPYTLSAVPEAKALPEFPHVGAVLLGDASAIQPDADKARHATIILLQQTGELCTQELASMLPPLLLEVSPTHRVLDMCAAPGSKTLQLLDDMHRGIPIGETPSGLLVANDVDQKRLQRLLQRVKCFPRGPLMCTCVPAQKFPALLTASRGQHRFATWTTPSKREPDGQFKLKFDRVLCDVPCSSDGGIRKGVRRAWSAADGLALHRKQLGILLRGLELLAAGGQLVYSTCSLNPIEDEAVVAAALAELGGSAAGVEVLDRSCVLGGIPCCGGIAMWRVPHPEFGALDASERALLGAPDGFYGRLADVPPLLRGGKIRATMFPPAGSGTNAEWVRSQLRNCVRVLPGTSNGGFFLALLSKRGPTEPRPEGPGASSNDLLKVPATIAPEEAASIAQAGADDEGPSLIQAGSHVTVRSTAAPAVVIGPGVVKYRGLVKIRYPDKTTYHVSLDDLELAAQTAKHNGEPRRSSRKVRENIECGRATDSEEAEDTPEPAEREEAYPQGLGKHHKGTRRPGARLFRSLGETTANVLALECCFGLLRDAAEAADAGVDAFPSHRLCFRPQDKLTLYLVSDALVDIRLPRGVWAKSCGMPLFLRTGDDKSWGELCPLRPCREAAPLLARCASRRRLEMEAVAFACVMRAGASGARCTMEAVAEMEASGQLLGLASCRSTSGTRAFDEGAVVLVLSMASKSALGEAADVAAIGVLRASGLEVFAERDVCLRLADIADAVAGAIKPESRRHPDPQETILVLHGDES